VLHLAWWIWAHRALARAGCAATWHALLAAFAGLGLGAYIWLFVSRLGDGPADLPAAALAALYLWYLGVLPLAAGVASAHGLMHAVRYAVRHAVALFFPRRDVATVIGAAQAAALTREEPWSRREVLAASVVALPPMVLAGTHITALTQLDDFRVRSFDLPLPALPPALDGVTIAHVSDIHVGKFTRGAVLERIAERTNDLDADLICVTGDLIDFNLDDLPESIEMLHALRSRYGTFICEGNHDLFESRSEFERRVRTAGLRMLINEQQMVGIRGTPVQLVGVRWGEPGMGRGPLVERNMRAVTPLLRDDVFKILLAHHPHAFDSAVDAGIDLTLAGHTHGGQLMLTPSLGPGSWMYKYWSGLYERDGRAMVVSNGVGNWFPLRVNAPAELVCVTLRRAAARG
jgi:hypothetical protein